MRRLEPKRELKDYESEGSAIRRIMNEEIKTQPGGASPYDRGVATPHYRATMAKRQKDQDKKDKAAGMVKLRKDDDGIHTVTVKPEDAQKYIAKGYRRVPIGEDSADESLWDNIHKKRARIKAGSGEKMRDKGDKGAPTPAQMKRAQEEYEESEKNINITEEDIKISPKLITLLRMGLVEKGELETMKRALKGGEDALKQPVLRAQIFELFNKLVEAVTDDQQIWVRMRKRLQKGEEE